MKPKISAALCRAFLALGLFGGAGICPARAATTNVLVSGLSFSPRVVTIDAGDSVTWNGLAGGHTVTGSNFVAEPFCGQFNPGATCTRTFNTPGTYGYFCSPHNSFGMNGQVIVRTNVNNPPQVSIIAPTNGAVVPFGVATPAAVSLFDPDGDMISQVTYLRGGVVLAEPTGPFTVNLMLPHGPMTLTAIALDARGARGTSAPVNITVEHPPFAATNVLVTNPGGLATLSLDARPVVSGSDYVLESSASVQLGANWTPRRTNTANGASLHFDQTLPAGSNLFWRVRHKPQ